MYELLVDRFERYRTAHPRRARLLDEAGDASHRATELAALPEGPFFDAVRAHAAGTRLSAEAILTDFGEYIVPDVVRALRRSIDIEGRAIELVESIDEAIRRALIPDADPSDVVRYGDHEVRISYRGNHYACNLACNLARGIVRGIFRLYGQPLTICEERCHQHGDSGCAFTVRAI